MARMQLLPVMLLFVLAACSMRYAPIGMADRSVAPGVLRLDGYYVVNTTHKSDPEQEVTRYHFFYENGTMFFFSSFPGRANDEYVESNHMRRMKNTESIGRNIYRWGGFSVNRKQEIVFEKWEPSSGGKVKTCVSRGSVLNDSTFIITEYVNNYYPAKVYSLRDTFHFRPFSPKPDSTNAFVH